MKLSAKQMGVSILAVLCSHLLWAAPAATEVQCTPYPKNQWIKPDEMKKRVLQLGYVIKEFKVTGSCYEVIGTRNKFPMDVLFNPHNGALVKIIHSKK